MELKKGLSEREMPAAVDLLKEGPQGAVFPEKRELVASTGDGFANIWTFMYLLRGAKFTGHVMAEEEREAEQVAAAWCGLNQARFVGAKVRPLILADATILERQRTA